MSNSEYVPIVRQWVAVAIPLDGEEEMDCVDACVYVGVDAGASQSADKAEGGRWSSDLATPGTGYQVLFVASLYLQNSDEKLVNTITYHMRKAFKCILKIPLLNFSFILPLLLG